jgi:N6-L-threonylcarbamoyladenine synthase
MNTQIRYRRILAIESSCDETAAAVVEDGRKILSSSVASSATLHAKYGGIVPEVAAREQLDYIIPTITEALKPISPSGSTDYLSCINECIDAIAIAYGPGLIGSLLVGVETAKTLSAVTGKPLIPVNHVLAHMYANFIHPHQDGQNSSRDISRDNIEFPAISLVVSGGHTELYLLKSESDIRWLGGTLDDAAGEAFDKTARLLGFENRGGPAIQAAAQTHTPSTAKGNVRLPRPMLDADNLYNFSFSGLKTAISREVAAYKAKETFSTGDIASLAYEVQESITDVLVKKTLRAAKEYGAASILLSGGVAANIRLREKFISHIQREHPHLRFFVPPVALCTDNAVYIACYAYFRGIPLDWHEVTAVPDLNVEVTA